MGSGATNGATFCQAAEPITWSTKDTEETKRQVKSHNAAGKAICGWGKK